MTQYPRNLNIQETWPANIYWTVYYGIDDGDGADKVELSGEGVLYDRSLVLQFMFASYYQPCNGW